MKTTKNYFIDTETYDKREDGYYYPIKDTNKYVLGIIMDEEGNYTLYNNKQDLQNKIKELTKQTTQIWAHSHEYDFYAYAKDIIKQELKNKTMTILKNRPLLVKWNNSWLCDTMNFYGKRLEELGKLLGQPKLEMPGKIKEISELNQYIIQDANITRLLIKEIKQILEELKYNPRYILTAPSLGIHLLMRYIDKQPNAGWLMQKGKMIKNTDNYEFLKQASKGGRTEAFNTGKYEDTTMVDINSAYWQAMTETLMPDLLTETKLNETELQNINPETILNKIGVIRCTIKTKPLNIGLLAIRYPDNQTYKLIFPNGNHILTGTWTTEEINFAIQNGYKLQKIHEAIIYQKPYKFNYLKDFINKLYELKLKYKDNKLKSSLIKILGNGIYGKLTTVTQYLNYEWINREQIHEYLDKGYKIEGNEDGYCISKRQDISIPGYGSIILGIRIAAITRIILTKKLLEIPREDLLYCDTDSIIYKENHDSKFNFDNNVGSYKIVEKGQARILSGKNYYIGETIKMSGIPNKQKTKELFEETTVTLEQMTTLLDIFHGIPYEQLGTFHKEERQIKEKEIQELPEEIIEINREL